MKQKKVRIKFLDLLDEQTNVIAAYLDGMLPAAETERDNKSDENERRGNLRVSLQLSDIDMQSAETKTVPSQKLVCEVIDLSKDGMSIAVPEDTKLAKGGVAYFILHFLEPEQLVRGVMLGLKP